MNEHIWIEIGTVDDLPDRVWMCNAHPGEERRQSQWLDPPSANDPGYPPEGSQP
jgi:hypothetical protein